MLAIVGNALIALAIAGAAFLTFGPSPEELIHGQTRPVTSPPTLAAPGPSVPRVASGGGNSPVPATGPAQTLPLEEPAPASAPLIEPVESLPITRVVIPSIRLDAEVVPAAFVERGGATTWDIPKDRAGHAQYTAGAGDRGNAVLLGHVNSLRSGDVFRDLDKVAIGDRVVIHASTGQRFIYEVRELHTVARDDTALLGTTETPTLSLFTCAGIWLPTTWDYTERLVVRAALVETPL